MMINFSTTSGEGANEVDGARTTQRGPWRDQNVRHEDRCLVVRCYTVGDLQQR